MPFSYGAKAQVWLDALDVSQYFHEMGLDVAVSTGNTTTFQATWETFIEGVAGAKVDLKGFYDAINDAEMMTLLRNGGSVLTVGPAGLLAIGDYARLISMHETGVAESSPVGGVVLMNAGILASGEVGFGWTLHPLSVDTNTTTGATRDDLAASATGWTAHLHVTAVSAGSWVVKLQDASASNFSDGADVTGASFTAATTATSQRLRAATETTALRRYVRYVATRTGGVGGDNITFGLAYSRN
jgi:hypothetical protein